MIFLLKVILNQLKNQFANVKEVEKNQIIWFWSSFNNIWYFKNVFQNTYELLILVKCNKCSCIL